MLAEKSYENSFCILPLIKKKSVHFIEFYENL